MSCNNCFSGCVDIRSDQCIKYTGLSIAALGISTGDPLSVVEKAITDYLALLADGSNIIPDINNSFACSPISTYLPGGTITLNDILTAIYKGACDIQSQLDITTADIAIIESAYTTSCLDDVTGASKTHDVLQAAINKICEVVADIVDINANLTLYELKADLNTDIATYMANSVNTKMYNRMIPYVAVEYYGETSGKFDINGVGIVGSDWEKIYLCNGYNGWTPDKRGRLPVGTTSMGNNLYADSHTDPGIGNPVYNLNTIGGANTVTLDEFTLPAHTHNHTLTDPGHSHLFGGDDGIAINGAYVQKTSGGTFVYDADSDTESANGRHYYTKNIDGSNTPQSTGIGITIVSKGGGLAHNNIPPVLACHYIMHIPS